MPFAAQAATGDRLRAERSVLDVRLGERTERDAWPLIPSARLDTYTVAIEGQGPTPFCFVSGLRSWCRDMAVGAAHVATVEHDGRSYLIRVLGVAAEPAARFTAAYQAANRGRTSVSHTAAYELVNVAIALTPVARESHLAHEDSDYYREVMRHFAPHAGHPFVRALNDEITNSIMRYFVLKMNAFAFDLSADNRVTRSAVYNRATFNRANANDLLPHLPLMQAFARDTNFYAFYQAHRPFYERQIAYFRDEVGIEAMSAWLNRHFPDVTPYDSVRVVFSPLVGANQSLAWMENDGFRELQPHVNFPYRTAADDTYSAAANRLRHGAILFTEMNHGYINPTAEAYRDRIVAALSDRSRWAVAGGPSDLYQGLALFNEMMNWGLVVLYYADFAPASEFQRMRESIERMMVERRGFPAFRAFTAFLLERYRARPQTTPLTALYPDIVSWFEAHRSSPGIPEN